MFLLPKQKFSMALTTSGFFLPQVLRSEPFIGTQAFALGTRQRQASTAMNSVMKPFMVAGVGYASTRYCRFGEYLEIV
jgi:hypothetical protein